MSFLLRANYTPPIYFTTFSGSLWTSPDIRLAKHYETAKEAENEMKTLPPVNRDRWRVVAAP